ncbi:hypothetical protein J6590_006924 [Homalodisca vitripennis]|nr:hypothetical protein J6590_006924 [Homalodisca vitripennis]
MEYNVSDAEVLEVIDPLDQNIIEAARPYNSSLIRPDCTADLIPSLDQYFTVGKLIGLVNYDWRQRSALGNFTRMCKIRDIAELVHIETISVSNIS